MRIISVYFLNVKLCRESSISNVAVRINVDKMNYFCMQCCSNESLILHTDRYFETCG